MFRLLQRNPTFAGRAALVLSLIIPGIAKATFYSYFQWQALPQAERAVYIAGVFDSYISFSEGYEKTSQFFTKCTFNSGMNNGQLAAGTEAYAIAHPSEQTYPVPALMLRYLNQVCGAPPAENAK